MTQTKVRLVIGPAGTGKTFQFIESARSQLIQSPEGLPLLFLAPKQATFQIENQLLADGQLQGFTRLQILSFPRLAEHLLSEFAPDQTSVLSEDGRLMILRSLLNRHAEQLQAFRSVANFPSFADEIGSLLLDFQRHQIGEDYLQSLLSRPDLSKNLTRKLHDLALITQSYREWLAQSHLKDSEVLLELATQTLQTLSEHGATQPVFRIEELWLDGFAEMTPQEQTLLSTIIPHCARVNLAFCLDPKDLDSSSWLNLWTAPSETYNQCLSRLDALQASLGQNRISVEKEFLPRRPDTNRFTGNLALQHLESHWSAPRPCPAPQHGQSAVEIVRCKNREEEVIHAARRILNLTREENVRFRDFAIFARHLEDYAVELRKVFNRYQIPYFIDQRERVNHHPSIVLTRSALRLISYNWRTEDLIAAAKTQLLSDQFEQINALENAALEFGWNGTQWLRPIPQANLTQLESFRQQIVKPFVRLNRNLYPTDTPQRAPISGLKLVESLKTFWEDCQLEEKLSEWERDSNEREDDSFQIQTAIHSGTWEELQLWIDNVELAFADTHRTLRDWLPILEAGLTHLTVGVIPPSTDQVLIGSIDRTRTTNIETAIILGLNESVFPALPKAHPIITEAERTQLGNRFESLIPSAKKTLSTERYYAYIACTRPTKQLIVSFADQLPDGNPLSPSSIIAHLQRLMPHARSTDFSTALQLASAEHISELMEPIFRQIAETCTPPEWTKNIQLLQNSNWSDAKYRPKNSASARLLSPLPERLYTSTEGDFPTSVSRLEQFAACPFRFFAHSGLRAEERRDFQIDPKRIGSFQHLILETFHHQTTESQRRWRDVPVEEARESIEQIARSIADDFNHGIFVSSAEAEFSLETIIQRLQEFISILIEWMDQYEFDPRAVELGFGGTEDETGPWAVALEQGRFLFTGKIDRLDIHQGPASAQADAIIIDYKSGGKKLDPILLQHGIQLQLLAYLNVVSQRPEIGRQLGAGTIAPAGVFFVPLKGYSPRQPDRDRARVCHNEERPEAFKHIGCFDHSALRLLDNRAERLTGDQIQYSLKRDGTPKKSAWNVMPSETFRKTMHQTEEVIRTMGNQILDGDIAIDPYVHRNVSACLYCPYASICRIEPSAHTYRTLSSSAETDPKK